MDWITITILSLAVIGVIVVVWFELIKEKEFAIIFKKNGRMKIKRGKKKNGKFCFRYNESTKGGIAVENNEYINKKKTYYTFVDENETLLPIKYSSNGKLELATSQEKHYETTALKNVINKINEDWWSKNKALIAGALIVGCSMIVSLVMLNHAFDVTPVEEPTINLINEVIKTVQNNTQVNNELLRSNREFVNHILGGGGEGIPR